MEYTQIDKEGRLRVVRSRIRELESAHLDLSLRLQAPGLSPAPGGLDDNNLAGLEASLDKLHQLEQELGQSPQVT